MPQARHPANGHRTADQVAVTWPERPDDSRPHSRRHITRQRTQALFCGAPALDRHGAASLNAGAARHPERQATPCQDQEPSRPAELI